MERIEEKGLLLSEYPPGVRPSQYTFPRRNRLISAWSDKLIVMALEIEAAHTLRKRQILRLG